DSRGRGDRISECAPRRRGGIEGASDLAQPLDPRRDVPGEGLRALHRLCGRPSRAASRPERMGLPRLFEIPGLQEPIAAECARPAPPMGAEGSGDRDLADSRFDDRVIAATSGRSKPSCSDRSLAGRGNCGIDPGGSRRVLGVRSEEHTSELQSRENLVCRLLLEKKKKKKTHQMPQKIEARNNSCS